MVISDFSNPQSSIRNPHSFERATPTSFGKKLRRGKPGSPPASGVLKGGQGTGDETAVPTHGAGDEARTRDIQLGKLTLYH